MKVGCVLLFSLLVSICAARTRWFELDSYSFEDYEKEFNKNYVSVEERHTRFEIFTHKLQEIRQHNQGNHSWKMGVNKFTDRTTEEFSKLLGYDKQLGALYAAKANPTREFSYKRSLPAAVDWRNNSIVTPVKDQGHCGSCWTFAAAETIESHWAMATGEVEILSEQQIASCTPNPQQCGGTGGCSGAIAELAYSQVMEMGGIASEWTYPYLSYQGNDYACLFTNKSTPPVAKLSGYQSLPPNELDPLMNAIAFKGPLSVSVDASAWSSYEEGVFNGCDQESPDINHAVQLVGYGVDASSGLPYWIVRNSWSPSWGEDGYIRLFRYTSNPSCGVDTHPQDGTGCEGGPASVTTCGTCGILYSTSYPEVAQ